METFSALLALCAGNSQVPVNSPHKGQWRGALMFSLICARIIDWVNNREAGDLRRHRGHYHVSVMEIRIKIPNFSFMEMHFKMSSATWRPFCLGFNVLRHSGRFWKFLLCHIVLKEINRIARYVGSGCGIPLRWRHNERDIVSNHQPRECLLSRLIWRRSKKTSKLCVIGLCAGNSPGPVNSTRKGPVTRKMFPFDDVIMLWSNHAFHATSWHRSTFRMLTTSQSVFPLPHIKAPHIRDPIIDQKYRTRAQLHVCASWMPNFF